MSEVLEVSDEALAHLSKADDVMAGLIEEHGPLDLDKRTATRPADAYGALLRSIVGQQLSVKAARTIYERMLELFEGTTPTPEELLAADPDALRAAGLSGGDPDRRCGVQRYSPHDLHAARCQGLRH